MKKKKISLIAFAIAGTSAVYAQEVISSGGESGTSTEGNIQYTIGETIIETGSNGENNLTQGFHQTQWKFLTIEDLLPEVEVKLFPNPTIDELTIQLSAFDQIQNYSIYDMNGKVILQGEITSSVTKLDVQNFATGTYKLVLNSTSNSPTKSYSLIKSH